MSNVKNAVGTALLSVVLASVSVGRAEQAHGSQPDRFISRARQLTFDGRRAGEGYFSPDGRKLIFQSERYQDNPFFQIYIFDLDTGHTRLISPGVGKTTCAYFRARTDEVLFASTHLDPNAREAQREEYERRKAPSTRHGSWDYDEHYDIFSCDQRGRHLQRLTDVLGYDAEGSYSPDGELIVFCSMRDAYPLEKLSEEEWTIWDKQPEYFGELYIMKADGSDPRRITDWPGYDGGPFFTPDGKRVIWRHFSDDGMNADIFTAKIDGTDRRCLTDFKSMSWAPFMHPSGDYAVFTSNKLGFRNFELFIVDALGEKQPVRVTYTDGFDGLPVFDPDGNQLCWTTNRTSRESRKGQMFLADWDHKSAIAAIKAAPLRGIEEPEPELDQPAMTTWPDAPPPKITPGLEPTITNDDLYENVGFLASDELEGRMTGSQGATKAAEYIAARFKEAGLEPMGDDGTYFQAFPFPAGVEVAADDTALIVSAVSDAPARIFKVEEDFRPLSFTSDAEVSGPVVGVGYGLVVPEESDRPGYDSYEGVDVKGKVVLVFDDVPMDVKTNERIRLSHYGSARYKAKQALKRGAVGFLLVIAPNTPGAGLLIPIGRSASDAGIAAASISTEVAKTLVQSTGMKLAEIQKMLDGGEIPDDFRKIALTSSVTLKTYLDRKEGKCRNVVGFLPPVGEGTIADQYILVGAHYDHIGHGEAGGSRAVAGEEGQIHNGADDNASGVATVLELAADIAEARRRSDRNHQQRGLIFACWSGEEIGVIGSAYFARHAPCPLGQIAAYVNFDMVGRLRDGKLILQGIGSSPDWLGLIEKIGIREPLALVIQNDPYLPTDTHEFYPAGIPVLAFFTDVHDEYNRPIDDAETLNYEGMVQVARFGKQMINVLGQRPETLRFAEIERAKPKDGAMGGRRIFTGTIPDFAAGDVGGMKISGVQTASPAEKAGMVAGDVIIEFAGHSIGGLEDYAVILRALKPDQPVEIVVKRDEKEVRLTITPTVRK
ncbi:MAG: M28 family peptidase [Phycisphaerales bacterium]|nr:MAG: M28 family peptidase [Phycisphaerales bacterium]